jgi:hypothetical protein
MILFPETIPILNSAALEVTCSNGSRGDGKFIDGLLLRLLDEEQNCFAMFVYTLHDSPLLSTPR